MREKMSKQRIDRIFSGLGLLSRSECKSAAKKGEITVNGKIIKNSDEKFDPDKDKITYKGEIVDSRSKVYYMINKPEGCITANEDKFSPVIFDYIKDKRTDLSAVGRLDRDTTGILLITNDGDLNHRLLSPKYHVEKLYQVTAGGSLTKEDTTLLERGMDIGDEKPTLPAKCKIISNTPPAKVELTLTEGRFHQVKRMFETIGKPVLKLHRSKFGPLSLDEKLKPGEMRELTNEELQLLFESAGLNNE